MDIFDLAKATGLSREQILYYAETGIITDRSWKNRREYFPEDAARLKKAVLFRKMGFDIYAIPKILDDSVSLEQTLANQLTQLEAEKEKFDGAYNLCYAMLNEIRISGAGKSEHLDAVRWSEFIRREEAAGYSFVDCWQDINEEWDFDLLYPFFVKDLRKNKRSKFLGTVIGCVIVSALWVLLNFSESGVWTSLWEAVVIIALLLVSSLSRFLLGKRHPRAASRLSWILPLSVLVLILVIVIVAGL